VREKNKLLSLELCSNKTGYSKGAIEALEKSNYPDLEYIHKFCNLINEPIIYFFMEKIIMNQV
jgi:transcriptional regulator with XRE-family HTH domain